MGRYVVQQRYAARGPSDQLGPWRVGTEVDLDDAVAEWVNRDSAGTLVAVEVPDDEPADELPEEPVDVAPAEEPPAVPAAVEPDEDDEEDEEEAKPAAGTERGHTPRNRQHRPARGRGH